MEMTMNTLEFSETEDIFIRKGLELTLIKLNSQSLNISIVPCNYKCNFHHKGQKFNFFWVFFVKKMEDRFTD